MITSCLSFPLYSKGAEQYRFEYAVFLLNKNIEQVSERRRNCKRKRLQSGRSSHVY